MTELSLAELRRERLRRQKRKTKSKRRKDIRMRVAAKKQILTRKGAVKKTYGRKRELQISDE